MLAKHTLTSELLFTKFFVYKYIIKLIAIPILLQYYPTASTIAMQSYLKDIVDFPAEITEYDFGAFTGFVKRHQLGYNLGYIRIPNGHYFYGVDYNNIRVDVHGGLTFSSLGEDNSWIIGFDTAHIGDFGPFDFSDPDDHYWTHTDVVLELVHLCEQLKIFSTNSR